jgi:hypothetical protein
VLVVLLSQYHVCQNLSPLDPGRAARDPRHVRILVSAAADEAAPIRGSDDSDQLAILRIHRSPGAIFLVGRFESVGFPARSRRAGQSQRRRRRAQRRDGRRTPPPPEQETPDPVLETLLAGVDALDVVLNGRQQNVFRDQGVGFVRRGAVHVVFLQLFVRLFAVVRLFKQDEVDKLQHA